MAVDIRLDDDNEKLLKLLMQHDRERMAASMVRTLIRDGLRERGLWPLQPAHVKDGMVPLEEKAA